MKHLFTATVLAGTLLLAACGHDGTSNAAAANDTIVSEEGGNFADPAIGNDLAGAPLVNSDTLDANAAGEEPAATNTL